MLWGQDVRWWRIVLLRCWWVWIAVTVTVVPHVGAGIIRHWFRRLCVKLRMGACAGHERLHWIRRRRLYKHIYCRAGLCGWQWLRCSYRLGLAGWQHLRRAYVYFRAQPGHTHACTCVLPAAPWTTAVPSARLATRTHDHLLPGQPLYHRHDSPHALTTPGQVPSSIYLQASALFHDRLHDLIGQRGALGPDHVGFVGVEEHPRLDVVVLALRWQEHVDGDQHVWLLLADIVLPVAQLLVRAVSREATHGMGRAAHRCRACTRTTLV